MSQQRFDDLRNQFSLRLFGGCIDFSTAARAIEERSLQIRQLLAEALVTPT
jgi:hypothetical protein